MHSFLSSVQPISLSSSSSNFWFQISALGGWALEKDIHNSLQYAFQSAQLFWIDSEKQKRKPTLLINSANGEWKRKKRRKRRPASGRGRKEGNARKLPSAPTAPFL